MVNWLDDCTFDSIQTFKSLQGIILGCSTIEILSLAGSLKDVGDTAQSDDAKAKVLEALSQNQNIIQLNLQDTIWTKKTAEAFNFVERLDELCLSGCDVAMDKSKMLMKVVAEPLGTCLLTKLDLRGMNLGHEEGLMVVKALKKNGWLKELLLDNNKIPDSVGCQLITTITENPHLELTSLGLSRNLLGNDTAAVLPKLYRNNIIILGDPKDPNSERIQKNLIYQINISLESATMEGWHSLFVFLKRYIKQKDANRYGGGFESSYTGFIMKNETYPTVKKGLEKLFSNTRGFYIEYY